MKKFLLTLFIVSSLFSVFAQSKVNLIGRNKIEEYISVNKSRSVLRDTVVDIVVSVKEDFHSDILDFFDAKVIETITPSILVVSMPLSNIIPLSEASEISYVEYGNEYNLLMDYARPASMVSEIQEGFDWNNSTISYNGNGVVTGLMDQGIDPNHINFTNDGGEPRVQQAFDYSKGVSATTASAVKRFTTDDVNETHGTHVAGIMAGGYKGDGQYCYIASPSQGSMQLLNGNIPFYGVATGSDIVMTSGAFTDANILRGVKAVIDYASSNGQPVVVNLSLGSNNGPHDGTSILEQGLSELGVNGIICVAAGNEGANKMFLGKKFDESALTLKTFILGNASSGIDIWTNNATPVSVTVSLFDTSRRRLTTIANVSEAGQSVSSSSTPFFSTYIDGSFRMNSEVNSRNNRFHVDISGVFRQKQAGQNVALIIEGVPGQEVYVYGYGNLSTSFSSNGIGGYVDGTTDGTISGLACGSNIIAVGSYTTRTLWGTFDGAYRYTGTGMSVGEVSAFSSFGTNFQGVDLPVICAPGANIQSSYSRFYTNGMVTADRDKTTSASVNGNMVNYWGPMQGTSMACPYVSGTVALWLEADPTLTCSEVIDILKATAIKPSTTDALKLKQWGGGKLDALAGIKEVLRRKGESGGIDGVLADAEGYVITPVGDRGFNVVVDGAGVVSASLYNLQGVAVASAEAQGNEVTLEADGVAPGVYILSVETPNTARIARRILLR